MIKRVLLSIVVSCSGSVVAKPQAVQVVPGTTTAVGQVASNIVTLKSDSSCNPQHFIRLNSDGNSGLLEYTVPAGNVLVITDIEAAANNFTLSIVGGTTTVFESALNNFGNGHEHLSTGIVIGSGHRIQSSLYSSASECTTIFLRGYLAEDR